MTIPQPSICTMQCTCVPILSLPFVPICEVEIVYSASQVPCSHPLWCRFRWVSFSVHIQSTWWSGDDIYTIFTGSSSHKDVNVSQVHLTSKSSLDGLVIYIYIYIFYKSNKFIYVCLDGSILGSLFSALHNIPFRLHISLHTKAYIHRMWEAVEKRCTKFHVDLSFHINIHAKCFKILYIDQ